LSTGVVHYRHFLRGYLASIPISLAIAGFDWKSGLGYILGYSLHRYVDNDWDIQGVNKAESRAVNELPVVGLYIFGISSAYGAAFRRRHRKPDTHWPYYSTIIRLIVLFIIPFGYMDAYGINFIGNGWVWFWVNLWLGLSHADAIHLYYDIFPEEE
jgi:hypothetical protein